MHSQGIEATEPAQEAEAIREALLHIRRLRYKQVTFCGDSKVIYKYLEKAVSQHRCLPLRQPILQGYLNDILELAKGYYQFKVINRAATGVPNELTRQTRMNNTPLLVSWRLMYEC